MRNQIIGFFVIYNGETIALDPASCPKDFILPARGDEIECNLTNPDGTARTIRGFVRDAGRFYLTDREGCYEIQISIG